MAYTPPTRGQLEQIQVGARELAAYKTKTFANVAGSGALNDVMPHLS